MLKGAENEGLVKRSFVAANRSQASKAIGEFSADILSQARSAALRTLRRLRPARRKPER